MSEHSLAVPGARLHYEVQGSGPTLLLIGAPMDSTGFAALVPQLTNDYKVVTYDPRGIGKSTIEDADQDAGPDVLADDVAAVIEALGTGPVDLLGSSGGAVTGLALVARHPGKVRTLIAHEPPLAALLPDKDVVFSGVDDIYATYLEAGSGPAFGRFMELTGIMSASDPEDGPPPQMEMTPEQQAAFEATNKRFFGHMLRPVSQYELDLDAVRNASTRIVVGAGATSKGQLANRTAVATAEQLGAELVEFPGDHGGFMSEAEGFARTLVDVLGKTG